MYRKILVTTDGSEFSKLALREVSRLAGPDSEVVLTEVIELADDRDAASAHLAELSGELEAARVAHVHTKVLPGVPGPAIVEYAADNHFDIIVLATHGRSGVARAVLGSVADYVAHHAKSAAVLLVRAG